MGNEQNQVTLWPGATEERRSCRSCAFYSALNRPRAIEDYAAIYGYCFKDGTNPSNAGMGKGYPVYVPEADCQFYRKRRKAYDER